MSRMNTSQRPPQDRTDKLRAGRPAPTDSLRREKQALRPPMTGRGIGGGTRLARVEAVGGIIVPDGSIPDGGPDAVSAAARSGVSF